MDFIDALYWLNWVNVFTLYQETQYIYFIYMLRVCQAGVNLLCSSTIFEYLNFVICVYSVDKLSYKTCNNYWARKHFQDSAARP